MQPTIVPIVEGQGEVEAVPVLLRRLASLQLVYPRINPPTRIKAGSFLNDSDYFSKYIELAAEKAAQSEGGFVVIILDCEDACPGIVGPSILTKAQAVRSDVTYFVFLAYREYETWFITAAESLRGISGLPSDLQVPLNPEGIRDAKGWLGRHMSGGYDPIMHQACFTAEMSVEAGQANHSFRRLTEKLANHLKIFQTQS